jgi:hypothetical protein
MRRFIALRSKYESISESCVGFLFLFKACKQTHSKLCNCFHNAEEGQKDKPGSDIIKCSLFSLILISNTSFAEQDQNLVPVPEPPELPMPVQSGETLEPDITIIRKGKKTIQEYRKNGELYMIKIVPAIGPAYYLLDTDGDGNMDVRRSDLDRGNYVNQWKILEWD